MGEPVWVSAHVAGKGRGEWEGSRAADPKKAVPEIHLVGRKEIDMSKLQNLSEEIMMIVMRTNDDS